MAAEKFENMVDTQFLIDNIGFTRQYWVLARQKYGLPFYSFGRNVRYRISEVEKWLKARKENA
jgi:hypothetical protein